MWFAYRAPAVPAERLARDVKADVLVVGMGIGGAMVAEALTAKGHSVAMIDRRGPLKGSTAATTALVQFEIDQPLTRLAPMIGKDNAARAWRRSRLSVANLRGRIAETGIDCRLGDRQSLYLAGDVLGPADLRAEAEARQARLRLTAAQTDAAVEVLAAYEGRGVGSALAGFALEQVRREGDRKALPVCPFIKGWIQRHPEFLEQTYGGETAS